jgi:hypothetical protein
MPAAVRLKSAQPVLCAELRAVQSVLWLRDWCVKTPPSTREHRWTRGQTVYCASSVTTTTAAMIVTR